MPIKRMSLDELDERNGEIMSDLNSRELPSDEEIDYSDIPPLTDPEQWKKAKAFRLDTVPVSFELSKELSDWLEDDERKRVVSNIVQSICRELMSSL